MTEILNFLIAVHDDRKNWKIKHCLSNSSFDFLCSPDSSR
ncbi:hypothetical protein D3846_07560 [Streptococcus mutans]|jgi:hypothetical protein|uniref:Uncharacterized protein n=1 Tax=Streptococcus mutans serotype c (strain ATCC 700610 / UA159) TaxID=210007 RepID=Q8DTH4_STRMU|nr:hypothetical protein SMU_1368 [Streptococcus mutans UA159]ARS62667.1 hypothetical protein RO10_05430 [Streptococcus mutans]EMB63717.1 hypothetical protein SMU21_00030 [Streptococcus mutans 1SM1]EMB91237.1 hypothetical protein SMU60_09815 [Streptococcus mutans U138]EMC33615.1 hypothetical protein SMU93_09847 [Streptococcus mutans 21]EMC48027.1 hypothetical protein SMU102_08622 [Streptococcus mutans S1B]EMP60820.1 hypothetical protein D816_06124 [Streptococcus mutans 5DC8]